jgi:eukaryotic-like serine/threonine-protein kinase
MGKTRDRLPPRYTDVEVIGVGGMGEIFLATDQELGRRVVVKMLAERYFRDEALMQRFKREALAAARLSGTPNIVTIFDVGENDSRPFIVMEYLAGGSLESRAKGGGPSPPGQVLQWLEEAASALDAAHAAGVVHRDVKPGNLLLDDRGHVHVADFGIASAAGMDSFTKTGTVLGTAGYLAPEQAKGERASAASDRYALGVVAFELLTGRRPFEAETPTAEAAAHIHAAVPSAHAANAALPRELDRVFERSLAKEPGARYPTAAEFVADLRHALDEAAGATQIFGPPTAPTRVTARRDGRRWWIPVAIGLLLLAGIVAAIAGTRGGGGEKAAQPRVTTFVTTVTAPGTTVQQTVTQAPTTTAESPTTTAAAPSQSGAELNDAGFRKMQADDFEGALPLLEQAVQKLQGTGSTAEAYADYNLAFTRFALGRCDGVPELLDNSERIQGHRKEIDRLRHAARKNCNQGD